MAPLPEKLAKVASLDAALARYSEAARAHNALLEDFLRQKEQLDWLRRQQYGTRSEKFIPTSVSVLGTPFPSVRVDNRGLK